jgi:hypothetical protein
MFATTEKKPAQTFSPVTAASQQGCAVGQPCSPTHEEIARSAYDIYVAAGRKSGHCTENWLMAERSLRQQSIAHHPAQAAASVPIRANSAAAR